MIPDRNILPVLYLEIRLIPLKCVLSPLMFLEIGLRAEEPKLETRKIVSLGIQYGQLTSIVDHFILNGPFLIRNQLSSYPFRS